MPAYSFKDCVATLTGPGGSINLGSDSGAAEEGITVAGTNDINEMTVGAGGDGTHSLSADESSGITVRLLKTSPVNAQLQAMYNLQTLSSASHGKNTLVVRDIARGDVITCQEVAFKKRPDLTFAKSAGNNEWTFDAIKTSVVLGVGTPEA